ncbi:hypothetical protein THAOC_31469 [Thalassiosira oceanica]|uniref:Uncharacterized protein n=1 Tax=Thalassiosira oceanica TaxID=159749 RepID=K0RBI4_THAOC|nr:hypothetical protein THAOC_31469 [Thalassiosira oceanica]|eukprot:EJK49634.1 hypothetical protein THAOC_31469 [Thalassiosira oceanica]
MLSSAKKSPEAEVATGFPNCRLRACAYKNGSDVAPAGAQEFERHPATYGRRAPVGHFGAADAELRTKPAGPKSEQPTENGPVATSLGRVQFEQNHSLSQVDPFQQKTTLSSSPQSRVDCTGMHRSSRARRLRVYVSWGAGR